MSKAFDSDKQNVLSIYTQIFSAVINKITSIPIRSAVTAFVESDDDNVPDLDIGAIYAKRNNQGLYDFYIIAGTPEGDKYEFE